MATGIGSPLALGGLYPSVDGRYVAANGKPFTSVSNAESALNGFPSKLSESCVGLTVLVKESGWTEAKEYWVQPKGTTPETYGLVEKGAGTTDYNDLDNKPTIGDGTNTALPIVGNVKVSATTATGENAGVTVTPGQNIGEIEMQFTLPKGADGADGQDGADGAPGNNGYNPFKGTFSTSDGTTITPTPPEGQDGDYICVINTSENPPTNTVWVWNPDANSGEGAYEDTGATIDEYLSTAPFEQLSPSFESGTISNGVETDNTNRIRSPYIPVGKILKISISAGYKFVYAWYDSEMKYVGQSNSWINELSDIDINGYIRLVVRNASGTSVPISPSETIGLSCIYTTLPYDPVVASENVVTLSQMGNKQAASGTYSSDANGVYFYDGKNYRKLSGADKKLFRYNDNLYYLDNNNLIPITEYGYVRFNLKPSTQSNNNELNRCLNTGLPILIKDVVDLAAAGSVRDINVDGHTFIFMGNGMIKNCHIIGKINIIAEKTKIFDNVYFHKWKIGEDYFGYLDSIDEVFFTTELKALYDVYNRQTGTLSYASSFSTGTINPFIHAFTSQKIGSFLSPNLDLEDNQYKITVDGATITLEKDTETQGNVFLPITKKVLFLDNGTPAESVYNIKTKEATNVSVPVSTLSYTVLKTPIKEQDGFINNRIYPEWFGDENGNWTKSWQNVLIHGGIIEMSQDYEISGGLRMYGGIVIYGNNHTIKLANESPNGPIIEIETLASQQDGISMYDVNIDGNKDNQDSTYEQDGIYADFLYGEQPFKTYCMNNTYWYNIKVQNCTGSGICVAVPGTSHIYSGYFAFNKKDGITWDNEHFTLTNVTCWGNYRHGAYASGNHWRIIGGAYAHNRIDNIYCEGAFQAQIIGCSIIDSGTYKSVEAGTGEFTKNGNTYTYVGTGGTHDLDGGTGIYLDKCNRIVVTNVRINAQRRYGVRSDVANSSSIILTNCQFNSPARATDAPYEDISSSYRGKYEIMVIGCIEPSGKIIDNTAKSNNFVNDNNIALDWDALFNALPYPKSGRYYFSDSNLDTPHRPSNASRYLQGTVDCVPKDDLSSYRFYIRLSDNDGNSYFRFYEYKPSTSTKSNDTGWKKISIVT